MSELRVATWNLFHGRAQPPVRADLLPDYAAALAATDWDVCGLQECPPWFARPLADACGASLRVTRTSLMRGMLPVVQRCLSAADPERLGVKGAAVNALLVRPAAGRIADGRAATLRRAPQRRSVQAIRLELHGLWLGNVHTHNKPEAEAVRDLERAIERMRRWADGGPFVLLGDLNVQPDSARAVAAATGLEWLAGDRVDHVLATPGVILTPGGSRSARRPKTLDGAAALSDHRLLTANLTLGLRWAGLPSTHGGKPAHARGRR
ncbi:MAG: endonuclease/exonuclease/phosphatase family protein [Solirubrobacteraceae bacterium]|nr:endonuclease/exonuclease/phosphatase family protein [Solirubrobacteraceae bacterium]